jgi:hypothetical protein
MAKKKKIEVKGFTINLEETQSEDYISLTDIARQSEKSKPDYLVASWMKNKNTLDFLEAWESLHNPDFKSEHMLGFKDKYLRNRNLISVKKFVEELKAIGIYSKKGRYGGGTYAHSDIALGFCYWLSPPFQIYLLKEFQRLKKEESDRKNLEWHISKITDNIDEVRNLLDTIPGQNPEQNRLLPRKKK